MHNGIILQAVGNVNHNLTILFLDATCPGNSHKLVNLMAYRKTMRDLAGEHGNDPIFVTFAQQHSQFLVDVVHKGTKH